MSLSPVSEVRMHQSIATCQRKKPQSEADAVMIALKYGYPMTAYVCMGCGCWHNGNRSASGFHTVDFRRSTPYYNRERYLARERKKAEEWTSA